MSQLLTKFLESVAAFNACKTAADYNALGPYYDLNATLSTVDPPLKSYTPRADILAYLSGTQSAKCPRFWPHLNTISETPNSDAKTSASLDGVATYVDCTMYPPPAGAYTTPVVINFHFKFTRPNSNPTTPWMVTVGST